MTNEQIINYLNFLTKTYVGLTGLISATKQRLQSLPGDERDEEFDTLLKGQEKTDGLETVKGRITRELGKELAHWDVWELWLKNVPGIGPWLAAELIILFYYRFVAICKECGGELVKAKAEGEEEKNTLVCSECGKVAKRTKKEDNDGGLLTYKIGFKDFPTISKWWAYMGRHTVDGVMPKRKKGVVSNWTTHGRTVGFHIGDQFNRQKETHLYKKILIERKKNRERHNPDWSKGHIHNASKNETIKIFLAHFWTVARTLEGKTVSEPYAGAIMGHSDIIKPCYWEGIKD